MGAPDGYREMTLAEVADLLALARKLAAALEKTKDWARFYMGPWLGGEPWREVDAVLAEAEAAGLLGDERRD